MGEKLMDNRVYNNTYNIRGVHKDVKLTTFSLESSPKESVNAVLNGKIYVDSYISGTTLYLFHRDIPVRKSDKNLIEELENL